MSKTKITIRFDLSTKRWVVKGGDYDISLVDYLNDLNVKEIKLTLEVENERT